MDNCTKVILALIAIALWGLLLRPFSMPLEAHAERQIVDVNIAEIAGGQISGIRHGGLSPELPVTIVE